MERYEEISGYALGDFCHFFFVERGHRIGVGVEVIDIEGLTSESVFTLCACFDVCVV